MKFVPWISIRFNKIFLVRGGLGANPLRVDVALFPVCPRGDTDKQNDGIELTQTRPHVFRIRDSRDRFPRPHEKRARPHGRDNSAGFMAKKHNAGADPDSPPTVAEIREVDRAIGDGDARPIGDGGRTNLRLTQHVILGYLLLGTMVQEEGDRGAVVPKKVVSYWINALGGRAGHHRFIGHFEPLRPCIFQKTYEEDTGK